MYVPCHYSQSFTYVDGWYIIVRVLEISCVGGSGIFLDVQLNISVGQPPGLH